QAAHIAHGGEAALQRDAGIDRSLIGFFRDVLPEAIDQVLVVGSYSNCQMSVCVDETGAQRDVAEIDSLGAGRDPQVRSAGGNLFSLDQDHATCFNPIRLAVEDPCGFQSDSHSILTGAATVPG